jgi:membrane protein implicated in regulation of membrane protease activity
VILVAVAVFAAVLLYLSWPAASSRPTGQSDAFTVDTAILIAGSVFYPALAFVAIALVVIALMLLAARVVERRRRPTP